MSTLAVARAGPGTRGVVDGADTRGGGDGEARRGHQPGVHRGLGQAPHPVPAHLGRRAVGVAQLHGQVAAVAARTDADDSVGPDAAAPVGQQAHLGDREPPRRRRGRGRPGSRCRRPRAWWRARLHCRSPPRQPCTRARSSSDWASSALVGPPRRADRGGTTTPGGGRTASSAARPPPGKARAGRPPPRGPGSRGSRAPGGPSARGPAAGRPAPAPRRPTPLRPWRRSGPRCAGPPRRAGRPARPGPMPACGVGPEPGPEVRERPARPERDLERPHDASPVGRGHPPGGDRVELRADGRGGPPARPHPLSSSASSAGGDVGIAARDGQVVDDGAVVEPGAAHQQRVPPGRRHHGQGLPGGRLELRHGELLVRVDQVEEVVRYRRPGLGIGLGGADVHAAVHAHGVDRDDVAVAPPTGELQCGAGLARRGRSRPGRRPSPAGDGNAAGDGAGVPRPRRAGPRGGAGGPR